MSQDISHRARGDRSNFRKGEKDISDIALQAAEVL
jgi:hypothetical protein